MESAQVTQHPQTHSHKLHETRPAKLNLTSIAPNYKRWAECKIVGKNITVRSYAAACSHNSQLFVYGGLQILNGILSDFSSINLGQEEGRFQWKEIKASGDNPGPRAKCGMVCTKEGTIYLIGGIKSTTLISNQIYSYDISEKKWKKIEYTGELPPLQSFGCCFLNDQKIILIGGYDGKLNEQTNAVYQYNIKTNQISTLFKHSISEPHPRSNCGVAFDGQNQIYMFGGRKGDLRMNDFWKFDLSTNTWRSLNPEGQKPSVRSGHIMQYIPGSILMYGGLHEVTWELDDLHLYDIKHNTWRILEIDSARKKKHQIEQQSPTLSGGKSGKHPNGNHESRQKQGYSPLRKKQEKYFTDTVTTMKPREVFMETRKDGNAQNPEREGGHAGSMLNQKRKKQFLQKKAEMLKIFQISDDSKQKYLSVEPISQAIKNSLQIVCDSHSHSKQQNYNSTQYKITNFGKNSVSKFLEPLSNTVNVVCGKKPCARDGHNSVKIGQFIIIFGGDRHHMSFNDIYRLDTHDIYKQFH